MALRISPSLIDSYRFWRDVELSDPDKEHEKLEELLAQIRGERVAPSEAMARGLAWHRALEIVDGSEGEFEAHDLGHLSGFWQRASGSEVAEEGVLEVTERGHSFRFVAEDVARVRLHLPAATNVELRGVLHLPEIGVVMKVRTDGVVGNTIHEHKTTGRIDVDRYTKTSQWRAYLLAFECRKVVYHVVKLQKDRRENLWRVKEYLPFSQYAYPRMREDLVAETAGVAAFIRSQGLTHYREETSSANDF